MMVNKSLFSSNSCVWSTPQEFFDKLNSVYHFTLDPCALPDNAKCNLFFTPSENGLLQDWQGHNVFCNPPYGREIVSWVEKCYLESLKPNTCVVALLPARTDTRWFHDFVYGKSFIYFVKGRLKFGNSSHSAPFPSMVVDFSISNPLGLWEVLL